MNYKNLLFHVKRLLLNQRGEMVMSPGGVKVEDAPAAGSAPAAAAPAAAAPPASPIPIQDPPEVKPPVDTTGMKSDDIKKVLEGKAPMPEAQKTIDPTKPAEEQWFSKDKGWKTQDDAVKAHSEAMEKIRQQAEEMKTLKQAEQVKVQEELQRLREREAIEKLSPEDKARQEAYEKWEKENADAISLIEQRIVEKLEKTHDIKPKAQQIEREILEDRTKWKTEFDKDENRKTLWPHMEKSFAEAGGLGGMTEQFFKNPFPFLEAMAFQKNFASVAERIRGEAVEQYKASVKAAEEAARRGKTEIPGGAKAQSGALDVDSMSSTDLAKLLPRSENG